MKYLAPALTALLALSACGGDSGSGGSGATEEQQTDMVATMVRHGLDDAAAACVADDLAGRLTPSMYAEVTAAATPDEIPAAWQAAVSGANAACNGDAPADKPAPATDDVQSKEPAPATDDVQSDEPTIATDDNEPDEPDDPVRTRPADG